MSTTAASSPAARLDRPDLAKGVSLIPDRVAGPHNRTMNCSNRLAGK